MIIKSLAARRLAKKTRASELLEGAIAGKKAAYICSGIGIANAARAVAILAERKRPESIIFFGIGGAYASSGLGKGDLAAAKMEVYAEGGLAGPRTKTGDGFKALGFPLLKKGDRKFFGSFPLDRGLLNEAKKCIRGLRTGRFLTVCSAGRSIKKADLLGLRYGAVMENMEGAAAAHTALFYGIPLLEIRGVSNIAGEPPLKWRKEEASANCQEAVLRLIAAL